MIPYDAQNSGTLVGTNGVVFGATRERMDKRTGWLNQGLKEAAGAIDRRVIWAMELMALAAFALLVALISKGQIDTLASLAIAFGAVALSGTAFVGACLLQIDQVRSRSKA